MPAGCRRLARQPAAARPDPKSRSVAGSGTGWANEWCTFRLRLSDFRRNGNFPDLANVAAVRFDFGPSSGSTRGRLGLDEIEITKD